jgi:TolB-like protein
MRRILLFLVFLGISGALNAASELVVREVTGYGNSQEEAITDALVQGVQQVRGVEISADSTFRREITQLINEDGEASTQSISASTEIKDDMETKSGGYIKSYQIISVLPDEASGRWQALVRVEIPVYKASGQNRDALRTLAILPFRESVGSAAVAGQLSQVLVTEFTQARKFRVLDREYLSEYLSEQEFLASGNLPVEETLRLGQRLGADFILVGAINDFKIRQKEKEVLGIKKVLREASLSFDFRVLEVSTQEIRWSNTFSKRYSNSELAKLVGGAPDDDELVRSSVIQAAGHETATEMLDVIFPLRIVQVEAGEVYLNQGGIRVKEGEIYDVFESGRKVIDPSTGLKLPIDGRKLASIEIVRVAPKFSVGVIIAGSDEDCAACNLLQGICRKTGAVSKSATGTAAEKSNVTW